MTYGSGLICSAKTLRRGLVEPFRDSLSLVPDSAFKGLQ